MHCASAASRSATSCSTSSPRTPRCSWSSRTATRSPRRSLSTTPASTRRASSRSCTTTARRSPRASSTRRSPRSSRRSMSGPSRKTRRLSLALALVAGAAFAAPDEEVLGKSQRYPVCTTLESGQIAQHCLVGLLSTWDSRAPVNKVARAPAALQLKSAPQELRIAYKHRDRHVPGIDDFLSRHRNTGLLVLHGDTVLYERYQYDRTPDQRFHSFSMAKTVVAM